jgi:nucleotide-binding universal stress UspA family protein
MLEVTKGAGMRVLFATDGSTPAREGQDLISSLFDRSHTSVCAFAVTPESPDDVALADSTLATPHIDLPVLDADRVAREAREALAADGFVVSARSSRGDPAWEILQMIDSGPYDLVVLGASHDTWIGAILLGRVSMHILHHAPCSVVITHRAPAGSGRILVGTDGSDDARSSLEIAMNVLDRDRCSIEVATVVGHPWMLAETYPPGMYLGHVPDLHAFENERIERGRLVARSASDAVRSAGFEVKEEAVLVGRPGSQLLKEADSTRADLIVVGSRGHGTVSRTLLGSVSDQVVRHGPATLVGRRAR